MAKKSAVGRRGRQMLARATKSRPVHRGLGAVRNPDGTDPRKLYLDLLERAVTHTLYFPPDKRNLPGRVRDSFEAEFERAGIEGLGGLNDLQRREEGRDWPVYAQTMVGLKRIRNVRRCVEAILADGIPGDLIEAGCWRGGTAIMMRGILKAHDVSDRTVWAADSFAGLPEPDGHRFPADAADINYTIDELAVPLSEVRNNFFRYGLLDRRVRLLEGWFKDTLPTLRDKRWALVRLDGDLYESTMDGLVNLYPQLSPGGFLIVDDFGWENCRKAVEDYRSEHTIDEPIERIDWVGAFWRKRA